MDSFKVVLEGPAPWGFRLQGGKDFNVPLSISRMREELMKRWRGSLIESMLKQGLELKHGMIWPVGGTPSSNSLVSIPGMWVGPLADPSPGVGPGPTWLTPGGKAAQAGVAVGDWVLSIDGENAGSLTHIEAQNKIRACGERLSLGLSRAQPVQSKPQKASVPAADPPRYTFAPSVSLNKTARPFGAPPPADSALQQNGQPLRPLVPDASKQRLMENTEDWRPRPGTGQSRSFRILAHLTGTEFMQDPDEEHLKKSRHLPWGQQDPGWGVGPCQEAQPCRALNGRSCSQVPRTEAPAPASSTPQEPWPGPTTPSPTSRPPWAVDPAFAERYAPDKTSTVLTRHSQPATPTPLQNRTSIVQAAAGGVPGGGSNNGKTPVCHQCHKVIRGRYLVALGHAYHPEEFVCSQCGKVLEEGGFFEEKGAIFCPPCYDVRYAPSCAKCKKKITGEIMHALKMTWHVHCFTCAACKMPIRNRAFYMEEGVPYCERDYEKMFGTKCHGCDFKIDAGDRFLEALGFSWHDTCFVCAICQINLEGKTFYSKKDRPLCKSHAFSHV
ncbi:PDZ and LIM domain protein 7 isoform X1 [Piliocolobus tephrosceles]|uniref:PDZ and LIM domain protein 7 isoform X1 n=1 Tax=Piliocolobus tephrosceles TaxID=591936 RepID=UPI000C2A9D73|nr:PDZ and LIM domain protein 7 isoform X1 [Piliocolobus tephrosceles]